MKPMRSSIIVFAVSLACLASAAAAADQPVIDVWPGDAPGETGKIDPEKFQDPKPGEAKKVARLMNVSKPTLTLYAPAKDKANGTAVIICPGGGYNILAWDLEGTEIAEWLNKQGVTALVLK